MKMTVYFDGNFWLGLIEYDDDGDYKVFRYFFGKEPKDDDVFNFINHKLNDLIKKYEFVKTDISLKRTNEHKKSPKRMQREINREKRKPVVSTKAQLAMKTIHMSIKNERQLSQKCKKNELRKHQYQLKQEKRYQKKKGH